MKMGQIMTLRAYIIYTGRTSMEVQVDVFSEEPITGDKVHTTTAHLTYVALNQAGQPVPVPPVIPESKEEIKRYDAARARRQNRKTGD
ncbi:MAG TPA: hypothetical protein ENG82_02385 [Bacteroidetes bacterium]|nr:hypothetical protein [Bacteroidota bacterium]